MSATTFADGLHILAADEQTDGIFQGVRVRMTRSSTVKEQPARLRRSYDVMPTRFAFGK